MEVTPNIQSKELREFLYQRSYPLPILQFKTINQKFNVQDFSTFVAACSLKDINSLPE
jgi:hypothetical protein